MPPLLAPPPEFLDQSFPRSDHQLRQIAFGLGEMERLERESLFEFLATPVLIEFVDNFDWSRAELHPLLLEILNFLNQLFLRSRHTGKIASLCDQVNDFAPHPLPENTENAGLAEIWCDELGKIFSVHKEKQQQPFFIGIACSSAFAGGDIAKFPSEQINNAFPLIAPDSIGQLDDAYYWNVSRDILQRDVSIADARRNIFILNAVSIDPPSAGSHFKVNFPGSRPWILDPNNDPIPIRFLKQLEEITGYPVAVVKHGLLEGNLPQQVFKLD